MTHQAQFPKAKIAIYVSFLPFLYAILGLLLAPHVLPHKDRPEDTGL
jgi:hypothetical protein